MSVMDAPVRVGTEEQAAPARSLQQRKDALREANRIRTHRKRVKWDLAAGRKWLGHVLRDPDCGTMKVFDALLALPKVGRVKANRAITHLRISPSKTCAGLSERQAFELLRYFPQRRVGSG